MALNQESVWKEAEEVSFFYTINTKFGCCSCLRFIHQDTKKHRRNDKKYTVKSRRKKYVIITITNFSGGTGAGNDLSAAPSATNHRNVVYRNFAGTVCIKLPWWFCVRNFIGSVPMAMGLSSGKMILSVAVLGILITAPLGALGMDLTYQKCLKREGNI